MTARQRRERTAYIKNLRADLSYLSPGWFVQPCVDGAEDGSGVVRDADSQPLAQFMTYEDAGFFARMPMTVKALMDSLELLQEDTTPGEDTGALGRLLQRLAGAEEAGLATAEGQRLFRSAVADARAEGRADL